MLNLQVRRIWLMVLVLGVFLAGCGREQVTPTPSLTSINPNRGVQGQAPLPVTLTGLNFAPGSTIGLSGTGITVSNTTVVSSTQITATFTISGTAAAGAQNVTVISQGLPSNAVTFTVTVPPPTIISTNPANGATAVPINQTITATFNRAMNPATINTSTFLLNQGTTPLGAAITGTVTYSGTTASFKPTVALLGLTTYTARVTSGAQDVAGNSLAAVSPVPNPWTFTTGPSVVAAPPTITLTNPADNATGVPLNQAVSATFSKPMDPATINGGTFLLNAASVSVPGTVTYNAVLQIATFTPSSNLSPATRYTATVTAGAKDLVGNSLVPGPVANPWSFTTGTTTSVTPVPLGRASTFGAFGGTAGITNQGILTVINGDIGSTAASTLITGFHDTTPPTTPTPSCTYTETPLNIGLVNGKIYTAPPPPNAPNCPSEGTAATLATATTAAADALTAYNALVAIPGGTDPSGPGGELGGLTLFAGVYKAAAGSFKITGTSGASDLTLDARGDPNAVFIFQMSTSLTVGSAGPTGARSIVLANGAQAKNVFWQVGSAATINGASGGTFAGTIIASAGVTFSTAGTPPVTTLNGRALSLVASVTMVNTVINVPAP